MFGGQCHAQKHAKGVQHHPIKIVLGGAGVSPLFSLALKNRAELKLKIDLDYSNF